MIITRAYNLRKPILWLAVTSSSYAVWNITIVIKIRHAIEGDKLGQALGKSGSKASHWSWGSLDPHIRRPKVWKESTHHPLVHDILSTASHILTSNTRYRGIPPVMAFARQKIELADGPWLVAVGDQTPSDQAILRYETGRNKSWMRYNSHFQYHYYTAILEIGEGLDSRILAEIYNPSLGSNKANVIGKWIS